MRLVYLEKLLLRCMALERGTVLFNQDLGVFGLELKHGMKPGNEPNKMVGLTRKNDPHRLFIAQPEMSDGWPVKAPI
jgi:hypothetical protein